MILRREFLKSLAALAIAVVAPVTAFLQRKDLLGLKAKFEAETLNDDWLCIVHPSVERDLRDLAARDRWKGAQLAWRKAGKPQLSAKAILERFGSYGPLYGMETGRIENIVFHVRAEVFS